MDTGSSPRVESGRGMTLTSHPLLVPSRAIPLLSLRAFVAWEKGETYLNELGNRQDEEAKCFKRKTHQTTERII
jgi:hypothetical protein